MTVDGAAGRGGAFCEGDSEFVVLTGKVFVDCVGVTSAIVTVAGEVEPTWFNGISF